ncbi:hypothetical protein CWB41_04635 [Methylovirgula ligni]|uniref:Antitoxin SocA-like Panacea domain-containing protein n=1 Tax=Methylovirgula ligni TaxID=569860 RepID=A0A3D9Z5S6_9HYPH|nr:hypothetical protein [Methylovirgula ligni]QAY95101.1 hypothetical protein CWB41_04635 [Methylovirgula ligni]REF89618.1 hypothetical protein DES32_0845 [Methylovirgula ligni]
MDAEGLVLGVLQAVPGNVVRGRKRLQKLAYFAIKTGAAAEGVKYSIRDFGPFSLQVANAASFLSFVGELEERDEPIGRSQKFVKVYSLANLGSTAPNLPDSTQVALKKLSEYSSIELEIASTISFFISQGMTNDQAIKATRELKPAKSAEQIVQRAEEALAEVELNDEGRRARPLPYP